MTAHAFTVTAGCPPEPGQRAACGAVWNGDVEPKRANRRWCAVCKQALRERGEWLTPLREWRAANRRRTEQENGGAP